MPVLQVATFNTHHCEGIDGVVDLDRTAEAIRSTGAELVGLQELDIGWPRSGRVDQPRELAERLGMQVHFWPTIRRHGGWYGLGIASVDPVEGEAYPLPQSTDKEPRVAVVSRWRDVTVICVHLSRFREPRRAQLVALGRIVAGLDGPVILLGDLNATRISLTPLWNAGLRGAPGWRRTMTRRVWSEIDHVLAGGGARVVSARSLYSHTSDHLPVAARVEAP